MNKEFDPNCDRQASDDILGGRLWDLRRDTRRRLDSVLRQAIRDRVTPEEAARRVEVLLLEDRSVVEAHRLFGVVSMGDALRSLLLASKEDPEIQAAATEMRREFVADDHPQAEEIEEAVSEVLVAALRADTDLAELVRSLTPPSPPRERPRSALDAPRALPDAQSSATQRVVGKESSVVDAKIKHRKGAWRAHCGNPMRGGCRGALGQFEDAFERGLEAYADFPPELRPKSRWVLRSDHGYGGDAKHGYSVLQKLREPRRPLPERFGNVGGRLDFAGHWYGFVGQLPQPPCLVLCPLCKMANNVGQPTES